VNKRRIVETQDLGFMVESDQHCTIEFMSSSALRVRFQYKRGSHIVMLIMSLD
jgi:hypothetical protein